MGWWAGGQVVGGFVGKWKVGGRSVKGGSLVGGFNKTLLTETLQRQTS